MMEYSHFFYFYSLFLGNISHPHHIDITYLQKRVYDCTILSGEALSGDTLTKQVLEAGVEKVKDLKH